MYIAVLVNCPSRDRFKYVACFVDHAKKFSWVYAMKTRDVFFSKLVHLIDVEFLGLGVKIKHYNGDGGAELISKQVLALLRREGSKYSTFAIGNLAVKELNSLYNYHISELNDIILNHHNSKQCHDVSLPDCRRMQKKVQRRERKQQIPVQSTALHKPFEIKSIVRHL